MNINNFRSKMVDKVSELFFEVEYLEHLNDLLFDCEEDEEGKIGNIMETMHRSLDKIRETANLLEMEIEDG